jgi:hypothetical protein
LLVLTCHAHVAAIFAAAGATVRSLTHPHAQWLTAPATAAPATVTAPAPVRYEPSTPPRHVAVLAETSGDPWPAEHYFFGAMAEPPEGDTAIAEEEPARKPSTRRRRK